MRRGTTLVLAGLAGLAGVGLIWQGLQLKRCRGEIESLRGDRARLQELEAGAAELARLRESEDALRRQVLDLRGQIGGLLRAQAEDDTRVTPAGAQAPAGDEAAPAASAPEVAPADGEPAQSVERAIGGVIDMAVEAEIVKARGRLKLTGEQEARIRELVGKAMKEGGDNLRKVLGGEVAVEEVPSAEEWGLALEQQVLSVLTPEQQTDYWYYKRQDSMAKARVTASNKLLQMQDALGLSMDQQDQVFAVFYDRELNRLDPDPGQAGQRPFDPIEAAEWENERTLAQLDGVLTAEQLETYRRAQEGRLAVFRGIRDMLRGAGARTAPR